MPNREKGGRVPKVMEISQARAWAVDPLMDELNQRKAVVFIHPSALPGSSAPDLPAYVADFLLDSVRAAVNLCRSGTMDRCPDIKFILSSNEIIALEAYLETVGLGQGRELQRH